MSAPCNQPQPPKGLDEDVEPRARKVPGIVCYACKQDIVWDGGTAIWCDNKDCRRHNLVFWNADLKLQLECS